MDQSKHDEAPASLAILLILAVLLRHLPRMFQPGPYWSGLFSELMILGLLASSIVLLITSVFALHDYRKAAR